jgi:squalene-associated FAD-dependent desaturase
MPRAIHIVGAGLAGLAAAVRLAEIDAHITVHEATDHAGGRCRSYHDHATGMTIDNGNHLLLSGNHAARGYLRTIGTEAGLIGPPAATFPFVDLATNERWTLAINDGRVPWWIFDPRRRAPGTRALEYLRLAPLLWASQRDKTVGEAVGCAGPLYDRLLRPVLLAALNIDPQEGSAALAGAVVRETLAAGGAACRPLVARDGLSHVLIEPALAYLAARGVGVRFGSELRRVEFANDRVASLDFGEGWVRLEQGDAVVLAVPAPAAASLVPGLSTPSEFRAIVNAHFRIEPPRNFPPMMGVLNGVVEWIFAFPGRLSVTISAADRLIGAPREGLARAIWAEVAAVADSRDELPPWQIVRERRATFAATAEQDTKRPHAKTVWRNLLLAGDWTQTGLPATIEGAIRSGNRAADLVNTLDNV